ncbi:hydrogenase nickel incorporation protein HypB [Zooshikella ganghwensis]|uniref:Hydrogenase maturation factor HypB n=1 Tax=Zooshikella ganghwensis TaxID=202772 RepID=A0A4P9VMK2_9GAMM|nr:hydrogenase nickel incorporation protein HypB [Zooshikella ganghwensis]RDH44116.1 hydrogenase accessory protein HypB [Zooshikella ganghwensis]
MCTHCGCSSDKAILTEFESDHHRHHHLQAEPKTLHLQQALLAENDDIANQNRTGFQTQGITCINLMGTPGAGKTALLEATLSAFHNDLPSIAVLEGDQQTLNDAKRVQKAGGQVVQINTGTGCHLDADLVKTGLEKLAPKSGSLIFIENVGNLVCPALFDLGESHRIAMMAVTDGNDKPEKYPHLFSRCELVIINKADLMEYVDFDLSTVQQAIAQLNPHAEVLLLSTKTLLGFDQWRKWLITATNTENKYSTGHICSMKTSTTLTHD